MSKIVIIAGSNGKNAELAAQIEEVLKQKIQSVETIDLAALNLPIYTADEEKRGIPSTITKLSKLLNGAKGIVWVTPEYNGGIPPLVSSFIAWISRSGDEDWRTCFNNKPAALATFSGSGGQHVLMALRMQLSCLGMNVLGRQVLATYEKEASVVNFVSCFTSIVES